MALLLPLSATGNAGQLAQNLKNAADLAIRDFQTANIQILVKDDGGTPEGARAAASEAISQGAELILGPLFARSVTAAATVARSANVPVVAFSTDATAATPRRLSAQLPAAERRRPHHRVRRRPRQTLVRGAAAQHRRGHALRGGPPARRRQRRRPRDDGGEIRPRQGVDAAARHHRGAHWSTRARSTRCSCPTPATRRRSWRRCSPPTACSPPRSPSSAAASGTIPASPPESNLNGGWYPAPEASGFDAFSKRYQAAFGATPFRAGDARLRRHQPRRRPRRPLRPAALRRADAHQLQRLHRHRRRLPLPAERAQSERGLAIYQLDGGKATVIDPAPKTFAKAGI